MVDEIPWLSATEIATRVRDGDLSPIDVVETFLTRIERRNPETNAYVTVCANRAREAAACAERAVENGEELGSLHGVPVAIKDLNRVEGVRTTFGSNAFADYVPEESDIVVDRLERAGAIILGKTNTSEFGRKTVTDNPLFGASANPWDTNRTTGGSSGGNAAALADGLAPIALGSDAAGSLRIPAGACGVVGFVPDFGRVPFGPIHDDAYLNLQPYTYNGPMARTIEDIALMLSVIAGPDDADPYSLPGPIPEYKTAIANPPTDLRIAYTPDFSIYTVTDKIQTILQDALESFEKVGVTVRELDSVFNQSWKTLHDALNVLLRTRYVGMYDGFKENFDIDLFELDDTITPEVLSRIEQGRDLSVADYQRAQRIRTQAYDTIQSVFESYDLLAAPTLSIPAFDKNVYPIRVDDDAIDPLHGWALTWPLNLTGNPTLAVPAGFTDERLPIGLQLVGPRHGDSAVLAAGRAYESSNPWIDEFPPR